MIYITAVRMSEEHRLHEHITDVRWHDSQSGDEGESTREKIIERIEGGEQVHVKDDAGHDVEVRVVHPQHADPYIRSFRDGVVTDNLLELPPF